MKVNKSKSPFVSGADLPDEKDIAKAVKGESFADALAALEGGAVEGGTEANQARASLAQIASQSDLNSDEGIASALRESAEMFVKSRLGNQFKESEQSEKTVKELSGFVSDDPIFKTKVLSVLHKLQEK